MRELSPDEVGALAKNVRAHRRALGLRPSEMAEYLGVSAAYLSGLELGAVARPLPAPLARLARLLDIPDWTDLLMPPLPPGGHRTPARPVPPRTAGRCPQDMPTAAAAERFIRHTRLRIASTQAADSPRPGYWRYELSTALTDL